MPILAAVVFFGIALLLQGVIFTVYGVVVAPSAATANSFIRDFGIAYYCSVVDIDPYFPRGVYLTWFYPALAGIIGMIIMSPSDKVRYTAVITGYWIFKKIVKRWDRNSFCRGWVATGATGCGKTEVAINQTMHAVFRGEDGKIKDGWSGSQLEQQAIDLELKMDDVTRPLIHARKVITKRLTEAQANLAKTQEELLSADLSKLVDNNNNNINASDLAVQITAATDNQKGKEVSALAKLVNECEVDLGRVDLRIEDMRADADKMLRQIDSHKYSEYPWGGICVDEKGSYFQVLEPTTRSYLRRHHLQLIQTRPSWLDKSIPWTPKAQLNLLSDHRIPASTYADALVKTGQSVTGQKGGGGNSGYFNTQAAIYIEAAIAMDRAVRRMIESEAERGKKIFLHTKQDSTLKKTVDSKPITVPFVEPPLDWRPNLAHIYKLLTDKEYLNNFTTKYSQEGTSRGYFDVVEACGIFKNKYLMTAKDELSGIMGTIQVFIKYFSSPEIEEVFCRGNTVDFESVDRGSIFCVAMPQSLAIERRYVGTLMKVLCYQHILKRYDLPDAVLKKKNLLIVWQDEVQRFIQEEDGNVDVIRAASGTTFMACQSKSAAYVAMGDKEKAKVTFSNIRNRYIMQAATQECANDSSDYLGKSEQKKRSYTSGTGSRSTTTNTEEKYKVEPSRFTELAKFTTYLCFCDGPTFDKCVVPPITPDGKLPFWFNSKMALKGQSWDTQFTGWVVNMRDKLGILNPPTPADLLAAKKRTKRSGKKVNPAASGKSRAQVIAASLEATKKASEIIAAANKKALTTEPNNEI